MPAVAKSTGSYSSGAPSSEGGSSAASHESLGILGHGEDGETDLLRGNSSSKKVRAQGRRGQAGQQRCVRTAAAAADAHRLPSTPPPQETFFGVLFYIYTNRWLPTDWRYVGLATVLQWVQVRGAGDRAQTARVGSASPVAHQLTRLAPPLLQLLILFFGPTFGWNIDWKGNGWVGRLRAAG